MATVKPAYAGNASITITINSITSSQTVGRASTAVDNTSNLYLDAQLGLILVLAAGTPGNDQATYIYGYGTTDGTNYTEAVTGTDASFTINNPTGMPLIGIVPMPTAAKTYNAGPYSVAAAFGGLLPQKWGIVLVNFSGVTYSTGCSVNYTGINATVL